MKIWQMVIILVLAAGILATMFLPAYRVDGNAIVSMLQKANEKAEDDLEYGALGSLVDDLVDQFLEDQKESFDEKIKEFEEEKDIKISSVTPFEIMTHNAQSFFGTEEDGEEAEEDEKDARDDKKEGDEDEKDARDDKKEDDGDEEDNSLESRLEKYYTMVRVMLWMVYGLAFVVMVIAVLGVALKLTKYLPLAACAAYSVGAMAVFGIGKFLSPSILADNISKAEGLFDSGIFAEADEVFGTGLRQAVLADWITGKMFSGFVGIGFLIGLIFAAILLVVNVIFMLIGDRPEAVSAPIPGMPGNQGMPGSQEMPGNQGMPGDQGMPGSQGMPENQGMWGQPQPWAQQQPVAQPQRKPTAQPQQIQQQPPQAQQQQVQQQQPWPANTGMGQVACTKGVALGKCFSLPQERKVVVGRNERNANLVVNYPKVSNVHCSIRYKAATNTYIVKDHSTNGTFANGIRMRKDVGEELPAGTVLQLADGANEITLG